MAIIWREQMNVGIKAIDDDHRSLIAIINEFEDALAAGMAPARLQNIAKKLHDYARSHFDREEKLQIAAKYPFHEAHRREHERLMKDLEAFIRTYFVDKTSPVSQLTADQLSTFMKGWLVDHIIKSDLRMKGNMTMGR